MTIAAQYQKKCHNALKNAANYGLTDKDLEGTRIVWPSVTFRTE